ncbi:hypothetical protein [Paenibacillus sp. MMS18-CY102]|uniref:hypothetical protein n=1 Tax=Paenibacillus sp. MMS18-CY102 TaxID=2682849 RepID=UPI00136549D8|nr:hypothetical protein [Paenibacillus sp. MMS18-CY102]MWC26623.1 hypothetical protein [Paenibacillus sp. MMS18-CY102]
MPETTSRLGLKKPLGNENVTRAAYRENLEIIDANAARQADVGDMSTVPTASKTAAGAIEELHTAMTGMDAVSDDRIGDRTVNPTLVPTGLTGKLTQWLSWFANRFKAITGKANWYDTPRTTLENAVKRDGDSMSGRLHIKAVDSKELTIGDWVEISANTAGVTLYAMNAYIVDGGIYKYANTHPTMGAMGMRMTMGGQFQYFDTGRIATTADAAFTPVWRDLWHAGNHNSSDDPHTQYAPKASPSFTGIVTSQSTATLGSTVGDTVELRRETGSVNGNVSGFIARLRRVVAGTGWVNADVDILRRTDATDQQRLSFRGDGGITIAGMPGSTLDLENSHFHIKNGYLYVMGIQQAYTRINAGKLEYHDGSGWKPAGSGAASGTGTTDSNGNLTVGGLSFAPKYILGYVLDSNGTGFAGEFSVGKNYSNTLVNFYYYVNSSAMSFTTNQTSGFTLGNNGFTVKAYTNDWTGNKVANVRWYAFAEIA